jgi:hypothetical protein
LVVPHVVRYAPYGTINDRPWVNIWDVEISEGRPAAATTIRLVGEAIADTYNASLKGILANTWSMQGVRWVDLDSLNGQVGNILDTPAAYSFPFPGTGVGTAAPGNVAVLLTKATTGGRAQRRGRAYLCGILTGDLLGQTVQPSKLTAYSTFASALLTNVNGAAGASSVQMVVVHRPLQGAVNATAVTSIAPASRLATLRRRLRS